MSQPVRWSTDALTNLSKQLAYIAVENPSAAHRVADAIDKTALALGDMPVGRPGRVTRTYEKLVTGLPYILAYTITEAAGAETVAIIRVIHTAQNWSSETWPD